MGSNAGERHLLRTRSDVGQGRAARTGPRTPRGHSHKPLALSRRAPAAGAGEGPRVRGLQGREGLQRTQEGQGSCRGISSSAPGSLRGAAPGAGTRGVCCSLSSGVSLRCPNLWVGRSGQHSPVLLLGGPQHGAPSPAIALPSSLGLLASAGSPVLCPLRPQPSPCRHHGLAPHH